MCTAEKPSEQRNSDWYEPQLDLPQKLDSIDIELGRMVDAIKALVKAEARFAPRTYRPLIEEVILCLHQSRRLSREQRDLMIDFIENDTWATSLSEMLDLIDRLREKKDDGNK